MPRYAVAEVANGRPDVQDFVFPFDTEREARRAADRLTARTGTDYVVLRVGKNGHLTPMQ